MYIKRKAVAVNCDGRYWWDKSFAPLSECEPSSLLLRLCICGLLAILSSSFMCL